MVTYPSMQFPQGFMLAVQRAPVIDPYGDGNFQIDHQIGPCHLPHEAIRPRMSSSREARAQKIIKVRAPIGSDITKADRVQLPNGVLCVVISEPWQPRNPWSGWQPTLHFEVKEVS